MAKVTALGMDTIHEKSGHQMTGMAVSVCLTPAARYEYDEERYLVAEHLPNGITYRFLYAEVGGTKRCVETCGEIPGGDVLSAIGADALTGLHYNRYRYYAPDLHVFLTPDPLGLLGSLQDIGFAGNETTRIQF